MLGFSLFCNHAALRLTAQDRFRELREPPRAFWCRPGCRTVARWCRLWCRTALIDPPPYLQFVFVACFQLQGNNRSHVADDACPAGDPLAKRCRGQMPDVNLVPTEPSPGSRPCWIASQAAQCRTGADASLYPVDGPETRMSSTRARVLRQGQMVEIRSRGQRSHRFRAGSEQLVPQGSS